MHELSIATWFIHLTSLFEWIIAIFLISQYGKELNNIKIFLLALAMLPNLGSAMAAITWHIFDNADSLKLLVVIQASLTMLGNTTLAIAAWNLYRMEKQKA